MPIYASDYPETADSPISCECGQPDDLHADRNCRIYHNAYMREHRPKYSELSDRDRQRSNVRAYANTYLRRGLITRQPCIECGSEDSQMHHENYSKPLVVIWLCQLHHVKRHNNVKHTRQ